VPASRARPLSLVFTSFASAASLLAAPLETEISVRVASDVRKAATSWHSAEVSGGDSGCPLPEEEATAADDGALAVAALPVVVPPDPHALVIAAMLAMAAAAFHQADVLTARRFIAVLTVRVPIAVRLPVAGAVSLPGQYGSRIVHPG
jgi:hypothetical protein